MTHKKKQFQKPMLRLVAMESTGIMAASGEDNPSGAKFGLTGPNSIGQGNSANWSDTNLNW